MPTYEYECQKCKKTFEFFQSMKDDALTVCPEEACRMRSWGKGKVKRLLGTGAGLLFKGSGFYITDYRSEGYKQAASKDQPKTESKDKPKTDSPKKEKPKSDSQPTKTGKKSG